MATLSNWFGQLNGWWKVAGIVVTIFSAGLAVGSSVAGALQVPARVVTLEERAQQLAEQLEDVKADIAAIRKTNQQTLCLTIAERNKTDWRKCIE